MFVRLWLSDFDCQTVIGKLWLPQCDCHILIVRLLWSVVLNCGILVVGSWLSEFDCRALILRPCMSDLDCRTLIVWLWLSDLDCRTLIVKLWLSDFTCCWFWHCYYLLILSLTHFTGNYDHLDLGADSFGLVQTLFWFHEINLLLCLPFSPCPTWQNKWAQNAFVRGSFGVQLQKFQVGIAYRVESMFKARVRFAAGCLEVLVLQL